MSDPKMPSPEDLAKVVGGNRVAILAAKPEKLARGVRCCSNCYNNPSGEVCQLDPLKSNAIPTQGAQPGQINFMNFSIPQKVPPEYVCSHHQYEVEVEPLRRRDVTELQIKEARANAGK